MAHDFELLDTASAARALGLRPSTLNKWRTTGCGPRFVRLGAAVRYRRVDLAAFIECRVVASTAEAKGRRS